MKFETLLAKSFDEFGKIPTCAKLLSHLRLVEDAGKAIVKLVGEKILEQAGLKDEIWLLRLERGLPFAGLCHDIGKANDGFQKMVRGKLSPKLQPIRHELIGALLLVEEGEVRNWALSRLSEDGKFDDAEELLECVIGAVGGHHRKLDEEWKKASIALRDGGCGQKVSIFLTHDDLKPLFNEKITQDIVFDLLKNVDESLENKKIDFKLGSKRFAKKLKKNPDWQRFSAILKALTSAADVAGSALPEKDVKLKEWIEINLAESQFLRTEQMLEIVKVRLKGNELREFQKKVAGSKARVALVEAGCGTGKTVAAYAWAAAHADGKKLFFCYPTTGTATEGFLGYVAESDVEAELIHSRSSVDIKEMTEVEGDEDSKEDLENEKRVRIESLKMWFPQIVVCTADTVLSLVRNNRRGWYNSPSILSASFVFDEIHAYDNRMFAAVIALIKALPNAHFLLMTASLPKKRKEFLLNHVKNIEQIPTQKELEELKRYRFNALHNKKEAFEVVEKAGNENLKILWICNTVARTQEVFDELKTKGLSVQTYHSRFKYKDRKDRHREVIDGFDREKSDKGLIAVTTQVAEMSLDLDADILISEIAPASSMIQRLGRLNRFITAEKPGKPRTAHFIMLEQGKFRPYRDSEMENGKKWLNELIDLNRPLSQFDLAEYFEKLPTDDQGKLDILTNWLDSGWFATPEPVREPNVSVSVILEEDKKTCLQDRKQIVNKAIPMIYRKGIEKWHKVKSNFIAPPNTIAYCKERGARWL